MLFVIGLDDPKKHDSGFYLYNKEEHSNDFDLERDKIWNVLVSVPSDDAFGLSDVVTQTTMDGDAIAEVYTSHGFLHAYSRQKDLNDTEDGYKSLLRTKARPNEIEYLRSLCGALGGIDLDANQVS